MGKKFARSQPRVHDSQAGAPTLAAGSNHLNGVLASSHRDGLVSPDVFRKVLKGDARDLRKLRSGQSKEKVELENSSIDLIVTSPPYWRKRDYGHKRQIGQEASPEEYASEILRALKEWKRVLRPTGSIFLNIGDTYWRKSLQGIPSLIEVGARKEGLILRNRIAWIKSGGLPDPARDRLTNRHEYILHFALNGYYYDLFGYSQHLNPEGQGANPGDVWEIPRTRHMGDHLAPFPAEVAKRAILLACPLLVCRECGQPQQREVKRSLKELNPNRPQARRALELARENGLTDAHLAAIRATGISDAGKARNVQSGTGRNSKQVKKLAREAKKALGGYFREFTFAKLVHSGWTACRCNASFDAGVVLDPFMGTGTTLDIANQLGRSAIGVDLDVTQAKAAAQ